MTERAPEGESGGAAKMDVGKPPIVRGVINYFPNAIRQVALVSEYGARKYDWNGWADVPNGEQRYADAIGRHLVDAATEPYDTDPEKGSDLPHLAQVAWNALATLELALRNGTVEMVAGREIPPPGMGMVPPDNFWRDDVQNVEIVGRRDLQRLYEHINDLREMTHRDVAHAVQEAFRWETTPQGFDYWEKVKAKCFHFGKDAFTPEDEAFIRTLFGWHDAQKAKKSLDEQTEEEFLEAVASQAQEGGPLKVQHVVAD